jgi:hypothetical protein
MPKPLHRFFQGFGGRGVIGQGQNKALDPYKNVTIPIKDTELNKALG